MSTFIITYSNIKKWNTSWQHNLACTSHSDWQSVRRHNGWCFVDLYRRAMFW